MQTKNEFQRENGYHFPCGSAQASTLGNGVQKLKEDSTNYILIVNKHSGQATRAQIPSADMLLKSTQINNSPKFILTENKSKLSGTNIMIKNQHSNELKPHSKIVSRCTGHLARDHKEDVKINFSSLGFDDYDSTASSKNVFKDDQEEVSTAVKSIDEGYSETMTIEGFGQQHKTNFSLSDTQEMKSPYDLSRHCDTPSCKDLSESSGYQSGGGSSWFTSPSSDWISPGQKVSSTKQVYLVSPCQSSKSGKITNNCISDIVSNNIPSSCPTTSPVSSLACHLQGAAFFQSPSSVSPAMSFPQTDLGKPLSASTPVTSNPLVVSCNRNQASSSPLLNAANCSSQPQTSMQVVRTTTTATPQLSTNKNLKSMNIVLPNLSQVPKSKTKMTITGDGKIKSEPPDPQAGEVVIHFNIKEQQTVVKFDDSRPATPSTPQTIQIDPLPNENSSDSLNNSLTNMHWLKGIQGIDGGIQESPKVNNPLPEVQKGGTSNSPNPLQWRCLSTTDVQKIARECGRNKRPPFSYMTLIQMGLNSREDKRMTLREICRWIEDTFPYYKYTAKPGWKNSIRHNLSLYSIFEREKSKKHGSHWTIRDDCPEKSKSLPAKDAFKKQGVIPGPLGVGTMLPVTIPTFLQQSHGAKVPVPPNLGSDRSKKGPQPILPRPMAVPSTPLQTYALIPIQNVGQGLPVQPTTPQGQPMIIQLSQGGKSGQGLSTQSNPESPLISPLVPKIEQKPFCTRLRKKQRYSNIAPKEVKSSPSPGRSISIVRQAWIDSQNSSTTGSESDSNKCQDSKSCFGSPAESGAKKPKLRPGLPTPKMYVRTTPPSRKGKARRKQKLVPKERELMLDSSEDESVQEIEHEDPLTDDLPSGSSSTVTTSTPFKGSSFASPQLPSPIIGLTPLRSSGLLDGSFLDCLRDSDTESKGFLISPDLRCAKKLLLGQAKTPPNSSPLDINFSFSQTPLKCEPGVDFASGDHNQSLSKFLADFPIDTNMMEDGLPVDISNLNWSVGEQDQSPK